MQSYIDRILKWMCWLHRPVGIADIEIVPRDTETERAQEHHAHLPTLNNQISSETMESICCFDNAVHWY